MMPKNVGTDPMNLKLKDVKIKYIGPAVLEALERSGIHTVADLAAATVDEIEAILEPELPAPVRSRDKIAGMIEESKEKVAAQQIAAAQTTPASAENQVATVPEFTAFFNYGHIEDGPKRWRAVIHPHDDSEKPEPPDWYLNPEDEGYTVRFEDRTDEDGQRQWRTFVYNGKSLEETDITGWAPDEWWPWISEKASLNGQEEPESMAVPVGDRLATAEELPAEEAMRITRLEVHLASGESANALAAEVAFEISDELLARQPSQVQVEVLNVNLEDNVSHLAGFETIALEADRREYDRRVEFPMPELGRYKPHCVLLLLPSGEVAGCREGDSFKVVPKK